jgi:hypothetical protein
MISMASVFDKRGKSDGGGLSLLAVNNRNGPNLYQKKKENLLVRIKAKIKILAELYFGDEILSYIHPSIEDRIENIRRLEEQESIA